MIQNLLAQAKAAGAEKHRSTGLDYLRTTAVHAGICYDLDQLYRRGPAITIAANAIAKAMDFPRPMGVVKAEKRKQT